MMMFMIILLLLCARAAHYSVSLGGIILRGLTGGVVARCRVPLIDSYFGYKNNNNNSYNDNKIQA